MGEKPKFLWDDAALRWLEEKEGVKKSIDADISRLRNLQQLRGVYLHDINRNMIMSIINEKNCSNSTKNRYLSLIRAILNACVREWDMLDELVYFKQYKEAKRRVRWLRLEEAERLLNCLPPYMAMMAKFNLATGLRQHNIFSLKWNQIDFRRRVYEYYPDEMKSGEPFDIALNDTAMEVLEHQLGKHPKYVFLNTKHNPVLTLNYKSWYRALDKARITDFRWHDLRHTWASWLVQNGVSLYELKEMGGWQSLEMVQKYAHLDNENLHTQAAKIDSLMTDTCQKNVKNDITLDYSSTSKKLDNVLNMMQ